MKHFKRIFVWLRSIKIILVAFFKIMGCLTVLMFLTGIAILIFIAARFALDAKNNTYHLEITEQDRLVNGFYAPSKLRKGTNQIQIELEGEVYQDCMLVLICARHTVSHRENYMSTTKIFVPKGPVMARSIRIDSYGDEHISFVLRANEDENNPIGRLEVNLSYLTNPLDIIFPGF